MKTYQQLIVNMMCWGLDCYYLQSWITPAFEHRNLPPVLHVPALDWKCELDA